MQGYLSCEENRCACTYATLQLDAEEEAGGGDCDGGLWLWRRVLEGDGMVMEGVQPGGGCVV